VQVEPPVRVEPPVPAVAELPTAEGMGGWGPAGRHRPRGHTTSTRVTNGLAAFGMVASDYLIRTVSVLGVLAVAGLISSASADPVPVDTHPVAPTRQAPAEPGR
jgi:hypothetical protein